MCPLCIISCMWHWPQGTLVTQEMLSALAPLLPTYMAALPRVPGGSSKRLTVTSPTPECRIFHLGHEWHSLVFWGEEQV